MSVYDYSARSLAGEGVSLSEFKGQVLLIVNTASKCGFTPQYAGLEELHNNLGRSGFSVLGFPCNQFGHQEPGSESEIGQFCTARFGVNFPMFAKIDVNGAAAHPLYKYLKHEAPGALGSEAIKWNFTKFLINRAGEAVARYSPLTKPERLKAPIEELL